MTHHAKAPSAATIDGSAGCRLWSPALRALGSGAPSGPRPKLAALLSLVVLLASLAFGVSAASATPPDVVMGTVTNPTYTTAKVTGEVDPNGEPTEYFFEVSTDGSNWQYGGGAGGFFENPPTDLQEVEGELEGLKPGTTYQVRLTAFNYNEYNFISSASPNPEVTTEPLAAPTVTIDPVTTFTGTTAHFSGHIDPNAPAGNPEASDVHWHFECTPECPGLGEEKTVKAEEGNQEVETDATGLEPNTHYEVSLIGRYAGGPVTAGPIDFTTSPVGPVVETIPAFAFGPGTEAALGGKVNPKNSSTEYWFEYGPGPGDDPGASYPSATPKEDAGSGGQLVFKTERITGLNPESTYHFRVVAENSGGKTEGEAVDFKTLPVPSTPPATCPNDKLRSETSSEQLGECRAYEMTTPPVKGGGDAASVLTTSPDGNRLAYYSPTSFPGSKANSAIGSYLAQRGASGWTTQSMTPAVEVPNIGSNAGYRFADFNDGLSEAIILSRSAIPTEPNVMNVLSTKPDGSTTWLTEPTLDLNPKYINQGGDIDDKLYVGRSADGSHIVFESEQPYVAGVSGHQIWEWVNGEVRLVSELPDGSVDAGGVGVGAGANGSATKGIGFSGTLPQPTAVSEDGSRIFFGLGGTGVVKRVFVREDGTETRELSLSERAGSIGDFAGDARFAGAAADGSIAVFSTTELLTDDATPNGGLYAYDLEAEKLRFLSAGATNPEGARLEGVSLISHDGSQVYFVAQSILDPGKGVEGGHNLYLADEDGVHFIATLDNDDGQGWIPTFQGTDRKIVADTTDGQHFVFQSYERLTAFDNNGHNEIYRYDVSTGSLTCVSCGLEDRAASGNASIFSSPLPRGGFLGISQVGRPRVVLDDGRILFQSTEALLPGDVNGVADVYLYDEGRLSLISTGTSKYASEIADISPDGHDVFFTTRDSLVGQDVDGGAKDVYDARIDGGFAAPPVANPCEGEAGCQGKPSAAPAFASPATVAPGRGNPPARKHRKCKGKAKAKKKHARCGPKKHQKHKGKNASKSGRGK